MTAARTGLRRYWVSTPTGEGDQLDEVSVTPLVLAQEHEVVRPVGIRRAVEAIRGRHIDFTADNRLEAAFECRVVELDSGEEISMVGDGHGGHFELRGTVHHPGDFTRAIEQTVVSVKMQVDEIFRTHREAF